MALRSDLVANQPGSSATARANPSASVAKINAFAMTLKQAVIQISQIIMQMLNITTTLSLT